MFAFTSHFPNSQPCRPAIPLGFAGSIKPSSLWVSHFSRHLLLPKQQGAFTPSAPDIPFRKLEVSRASISYWCSFLSAQSKNGITKLELRTNYS